MADPITIGTALTTIGSNIDWSNILGGLFGGEGQHDFSGGSQDLAYQLVLAQQEEQQRQEQLQVQTQQTRTSNIAIIVALVGTALLILVGLSRR